MLAVTITLQFTRSTQKTIHRYHCIQPLFIIFSQGVQDWRFWVSFRVSQVDLTEFHIILNLGSFSFNFSVLSALLHFWDIGTYIFLILKICGQVVVTPKSAIGKIPRIFNATACWRWLKTGGFITEAKKGRQMMYGIKSFSPPRALPYDYAISQWALWFEKSLEDRKSEGKEF